MDLSNDERRLRAAIGKDRLRKFRNAFERADTDDTGSLRQRDINEAFGEMGRRVNRAELREWMDSKELEEDGTVNFAEPGREAAGGLGRRLTHCRTGRVASVAT